MAHDTGHSFVGLIDHLPNSAKREPGEIAAPRKILEAWLSEQVALLKGQLSPVESILASYSLCHFDYDPIDVLQAILVVTPSGHQVWSTKQLSAFLRSGMRLGFRVADYGTPYLEQHGQQNTVQDFATCLVVETGKFNEAEVSTAGPSKPMSLIGVIHRVLIAQGSSPIWIRHASLYEGPFSRCDCLEVRVGN